MQLIYLPCPCDHRSWDLWAGSQGGCEASEVRPACRWMYPTYYTVQYVNVHFQRTKDSFAEQNWLTYSTVQYTVQFAIGLSSTSVLQVVEKTWGLVELTYGCQNLRRIRRREDPERTSQRVPRDTFVRRYLQKIEWHAILGVIDWLIDWYESISGSP